MKKIKEILAKAEIGKRIRIERIKQDLTIDELATKCNRSKTMISDIERGKRWPSVQSLCLIANVLGCTVDELVFKEDGNGEYCSECKRPK